MGRLRYQLPVRSPLGPHALWSGARAALGRKTGCDGICARVRAELRDRYGALDVLLTDSGTSALSLALRAAREAAAENRGAGTPRAGRAVALPGYGCYDLATAADGAGSRVLLYDLDPRTLAPVPASLARVLERGACAVVIVHAYGIPVDLAALRPRLGSAMLIEDAAQAAGATLGGRAAGSVGSLGVLSFGRGKGVTGGAGGALLANDRAGVDLLERIRNRIGRSGRGWPILARAAGQWALARPGMYRIPASLPFLGLGETRYRNARPARRMAPAACGILARTLPASDAEAGHRKRIAARLRPLLDTCAVLRGIDESPAGAGGYLRFPFLAPPTLGRHADLVRTARTLGIVPAYPAPLRRLPGFGQRILNVDEPLPGSEELASRLWTLPTHGFVSEEDLVSIRRWFRRVEDRFAR